MSDLLDKNQKLLIDLITAGFRGIPYYPAESVENIDWYTLIEVAVRHQVVTLIYKPLYENRIRLSVPDELSEKVGNLTLFEAIEQEQGYMGITGILRRFADEGIPLIVLKGIVLRKLYKSPELRVMGDYDLMIRSCNYHRADKILREAGYELYSDNVYEAAYFHTNQPKIDLHKHLESTGRIEGIGNFEEGAWERAIPTEINGVMVYSLCPRDNAVFLIIHMASHIISSGFGLRQLCDFVLLVEKYRNSIDWQEFFRVIERLRLSDFAAAIFYLCSFLFGLDISELSEQWGEPDKNIMRSLINDILNGGVHGLSDKDRIAAKRLMYYSENDISDNLWNKFKSFINLIFPKADKLAPRYCYARHNVFLLPAAWIHRFFYCLLRKDIDTREKIIWLISRKPVEIGVTRSNLLKQLGLID